MSKMPWFRVYSELLNDKKIKRISRIMQMPRAYVVGAWVTILCLANESPVRGKLMLSDDIPMGEDDLLEELGLDVETTRRLIDSFINLAMLGEDSGLTITNWNERQFKSDNSTARVQKHRAKQAEKLGNVSPFSDETLPKRYRNVIETETETETEQKQSRTENNGVVVDFPRVLKAYEDNIGAITSMISDSLQEMIETFSADWVYDAIGVAVRAEARSINYINGVLKNWKKNGKGAKPQRNQAHVPEPEPFEERVGGAF
jgi:DnaD/phage-associated family protein